MATQQRFLTRDSFNGRVNLPVSIELDTLAPFINQAAEEWLRPLLGQTAYTAFTTWLNDSQIYEPNDPSDPDPYHTKLYALTEPFMVYATWANYILEGAITATATGMVEKERANSATISDAHRAELRRVYKERAEKAAGPITEYLSASTTTCTPAHRPGVRFGKAQGRTRSLFETNACIRDITPYPGTHS